MPVDVPKVGSRTRKRAGGREIPRSRGPVPKARVPLPGAPRQIPRINTAVTRSTAMPRPIVRDNAEGFARLGGQLMQFAADRQAKQLRAQAEIASVQFQEQVTIDFLRRQRSAPEGAPNFTQEFLEDFNEQAEGILDSVPEEIRPSLEANFARIRSGFHARAFEFEHAARDQKIKREVARAIDSLAVTALNDPDNAAKSFGDLERLTSTLTTPDSVTAELKSLGNSKIAESTITGFINNGQFDKAQKILDGKGFDAFLGPEKKDQFIDQIARERARAANAAIARLQGHMGDHFASITETGGGKPGLKAQVLATGNADLITQFLEKEKFARETYELTKDMALMPISQQEALIDAAKPQSGEDNFLAKSQRASTLEKMAQRNIADFLEDSTAYLERHDPQVQKMSETIKQAMEDGTDISGLVQERIDMLEQKATAMGLPEKEFRPLSKPSAEAMAAELNGMNGDDAADELETMRATYGKRANQVMSQLMGEGLKTDLNLLPFMPPGLRDVVKAGMEQGQELTKGPDRKVQFDNALDEFADLEVFAAMRRSDAGAQTTIDGFMNSLGRAAMAKSLRDGTNATDEARQIARLFNDSFDVRNNDDFNVWIPKALNGRKVHTSLLIKDMEEKLENIEQFGPENIFTIDFPAATQGRESDFVWIDWVKENGVWVNSPSGDSAILAVPDSFGSFIPVTNNQGRMLKVPYEASGIIAEEITRDIGPTLEEMMVAP